MVDGLKYESKKIDNCLGKIYTIWMTKAVSIDPSLIPEYSRIATCGQTLPRGVITIVLHYLDLIAIYHNHLTRFLKLKPGATLEHFKQIFQDGRCFSHLKISKQLQCYEFNWQIRILQEYASTENQKANGAFIVDQPRVNFIDWTEDSVIALNQTQLVVVTKESQSSVMDLNDEANPRILRISDDHQTVVFTTYDKIPQFYMQRQDGQLTELTGEIVTSFAHPVEADIFITSKNIVIFQIIERMSLCVTSYLLENMTRIQSKSIRLGLLASMSQCCFHRDTLKFYYVERTHQGNDTCVRNQWAGNLKVLDLTTFESYDLGFKTQEIHAVDVQGEIIAVANWDEVAGYRLHIWNLKKGYKDGNLCVLSLKDMDLKAKDVFSGSDDWKIKLFGDKLYSFLRGPNVLTVYSNPNKETTSSSEV